MHRTLADMKVHLVGEASNHIEILKRGLATPLEIRCLPREAAFEPAFDSGIDEDDVVISLRFSRRGIATPRFRLLHVPGAGLDAIDFASVPAGCAVCNVFEHETPIAEYACAAMLEWEIGLHEMRTSFSAQGWSDRYRSRIPHGEVSGKKLALIGYGRIGRAIAKRARAFDMQVCAVDPFANADEHIDRMHRRDALPDALADADYVALVCPLTDETRGMINARNIEWMKRSAVVLNVSRAEIANEADLYDALKSGRIGGAVLDAWYQYPKGQSDTVAPSTLPFADLPNVICTAHSSAWTRNLPRRRYTFIAQNINRLIKGEALLNTIAAPAA